MKKKLGREVGPAIRRGFLSWRTVIELVAGGVIALWAADVIGPDEIDYTSNQLHSIEHLAEDWAGPGPMPSCPKLPKGHSRSAIDRWGREMKFLCGEQVPLARSVIVISAGPDGKFDTRDDLRSGAR